MTPVVPLLGDIGAPEIILILIVLVLLFGAKKLPDLARGSGRALRIFKAETKGLLDDDEDPVKDPIRDSEKTEAQLQLEAQRRVEAARRLETPVEAPLDVPVERPRPDVEH